MDDGVYVTPDEFWKILRKADRLVRIIYVARASQKVI
jgi:hypothetical protein